MGVIIVGARGKSGSPATSLASLRPKVFKPVASFASARKSAVVTAAPAIQSPAGASATSPSSANYFIDSLAGLDTNDGSSPARPWRSLAPLEGTHLRPGDTVNFARGSDWQGPLQINDSGEPGRPITLRPYSTGRAPAFHNQSMWGDGIEIDGSWVVVDGLSFHNVQHYAIDIKGDHVTVQNIDVALSGIGVVMGGRYGMVTHSHFHDGRMVINTPGGDDDYGALGVSIMASDNEVSFNRMEDLIAPSYDYGQDGGAVEIFGTVENAYIHHNWARGDKGFIEIGGGSAHDIVLAYNVSLDNGRLALFNLTGKYASSVDRFRIENNTVVETVDWLDTPGYWSAEVAFDARPTRDAVLLRNNLFYLDASQRAANQSTFLHEYNLYYFAHSDRRAYKLGYDPGTGEIVADPLFVNPDDYDFHLQKDSPAIDRGLNLGYTTDMDGAPVPDDNAPDLGAYESQSPSGGYPVSPKR
jgi:hypothetical protein